MDMNESDILEYLIEDPKTQTIAMYLEGIQEGRRFFDLCEYGIYEKNKIMVLLVSGSSEQGKNAIMSHTNSLANDKRIFDGMCRQLGIIQVNNFQDLLLAGKLATHIPLPKGNNIGLISISGAGCVLSVDYAAMYGLNVPRLSQEMVLQLRPLFPEWSDIAHPIDMWASIEQIGPVAYNKVIEIFLESGLFDFIIFCSIAGKRALLNYDDLKNIIRNHKEVPVILQIFGGFQDLKSEISERLELSNKNDEIYLPVVYNLESTIEILSRMVYLSRLKQGRPKQK